MPRTTAAAKGKAAPSRARAGNGRAKGEQLVCEECGLVLTVAEPCGCADVCDVICCEQPMAATSKAGRAPAARKTAARKTAPRTRAKAKPAGKPKAMAK